MKKMLYGIVVSCIFISVISISYAQITEKNFSLSSEFRHVGPFERITLSKIFLGNKLSLSLEFYGQPQIKLHRNVKFMINGYPYYAAQVSATKSFGGSSAVYDISGIKADGDILPGVLSNAGKIELEIPLENSQPLTWKLPEKILTEWKNIITKESPVHKLSMNQVSRLYVSILGRASEGEGNAYWCANQSDMVSAANSMLSLDGVKEYFGEKFHDNKSFITFIYSHTLGKDADQDLDGIAYWTSLLDQGKSRGQVVADLIKAITDPVFRGEPSQKRFYNRVEVSNYVAENISAITDNMNAFALRNLIDNVDNNSYSVYLAKNSVDEYVALNEKDEIPDNDENQYTPPPYNLQIEAREQGTLNVLRWTYPDKGDVASIEIWIAEGEAKRDDARLIATKTVDKKDMGRQGQYIHSGFDMEEDRIYWIRTISSRRQYSAWCPDSQEGAVVEIQKGALITN